MRPLRAGTVLVGVAFAILPGRVPAEEPSAPLSASADGAEPSNSGAVEPGYYTRFGDPELMAHSPPVAADMPFLGEVKARFATETPIAAFRPLRDGSVMILDASVPRLIELEGDVVRRELVLGGGAFDPGEARLVDFEPLADGGFALLDTNVGTLWIATFSGRIEARHGLFVAATQVARGADGNLYVEDPGNQSVVGFTPDFARIWSRRGSGHSPHATRDGALPFVRIRGGNASTGLIPSRGEGARPSLLGRITTPEGEEILGAEVLGQARDRVMVLVDSRRRSDERPRRTMLWALPISGGIASSRRVPTPFTYCADCGPSYRLGPDGALWGFAWNQAGYQVLRFEAQGGIP